MKLPGEELAIRLLELLAERGVGALLRPWQVRREGRASADIKRYETLLLAEAEHLAQTLRSGQASLLPSGKVVPAALLGGRTGPEISAKPESLPGLRDDEFKQILLDQHLGDLAKREVNLGRAILYAIRAIAGENAQELACDAIDEDWLRRWRSYAGEVSDDSIRLLWGRLLAGQFTRPGQYDFRTVEFIRTVSQEDARAIEQVAPFVIDDFVVRAPQVELSSKLSIDTLLSLQELGILIGVTGSLFSSLRSISNERSHCILSCHQRALIVTDPNPQRIPALSTYRVTRLGLQVLSLGHFEANEAYLLEVGAWMKSNGYSVEIARLVGGEAFDAAGI